MPARTKLIQGTFILTFVGILSRFMGFFFRMFTSHVFGEENIGLYQLIFPVYLFCLSLSTAGIEAAISRTAAQKASRGKYIEAQSILYTGLFFSVLFSIYGKNHTEMYRRECLLESFVARTINIGDRTGIDRVYPWKEKLPAAGSSGSFCRNDRLGRQRVLYRGLLS